MNIQQHLWRAIACGFLLCSNFVSAQPPSTAVDRQHVSPTTTFVIIRHAERQGEEDRLTSAGQQRAELLGQMGAALNVSAIYTTDTQRTRATAAPLAEFLKIEPLIYNYNPKAANQEWLDDIRSKHAGQTVLIVGHSNTASRLAAALGGFSGRDLAHDEYNTMFLVKLSPNSPPQSAEFKFDK